MVRNFQSVIGDEIKHQIKHKEGLPDVIVACVGGAQTQLGHFTHL